MKDLATKLASLNANLKSAASQQSGQTAAAIDKAVGGQADGGEVNSFFINKTLARHISTAPMLFGVKSIGQLFGQGEISYDKANPASTIIGVNFRDKSQFKHIDQEVKEVLLDLKKKLHNAQIQQQIMTFKSRMPMRVEDTPYFKAVCEPMLKAFNITDFSNWIPQLNAPFYFEEFELDPVIDSYFPQYDMQSRVELVPGAVARMKGRLQKDDDTFSAQYNTQSNYTMTAQDCVTHTLITEDLLQDMVPNAGGFERLRREVALSIQRSKEDAILNGDDTITTSVQGDGHMDSDIAGGAATLFNKAFKGLRKRALAASTVADQGGSGISLATYNSLIAKIGKFAKEKGDLLLIPSATISNKIICGNVPEILTHEKFGPSNATISTGNLPRVFGIEQYESEWVREDVNSSGVYASAQALTTLLLVKKSRFVVGKRAPMRIWAMPTLANQDQMMLTAKERFTFAGVPQGSNNETSVAIATNLALT